MGTRIYGNVTASPNASAGGGSLVSRMSPSSSSWLVANECRANHLPRMTTLRREKKKEQAIEVAPEFAQRQGGFALVRTADVVVTALRRRSGRLHRGVL